MLQPIKAKIEIEGHTLSYVRQLEIVQKFNAHHEFTVHIPFHHLEDPAVRNYQKSQDLIGKLVIITFYNGFDNTEIQHYTGVVCETTMSRINSVPDIIILKGYSPTITLESGAQYGSFLDKTLKEIACKVTEPMLGAGFRVAVSPEFSNKLGYMCQYRESNFQFLNRLSSYYNEWLYYDGVQLFFGQPSSPPEIELSTSADIYHMQHNLKIKPLQFSNYSYLSKNDQTITHKASGTEQLSSLAGTMSSAAQQFFSSISTTPFVPRADSQNEMAMLQSRQMNALGSELDTIVCLCNNPKLVLGAKVKIASRLSPNQPSEISDFGSFIITSLTHRLDENGAYHNEFEAVEATPKSVPTAPIALPIAETQIAKVIDNKDPQNLGRIKAQMLWQEKDNETTDWIRVMTPDAGSGKDGAKNRGFVVVPEIGDQVMIHFRYNDPCRPFVLGGMFHGKSGGGGGQGNNNKSLISKSGHKISLDDGGGITIVDKSGNNSISIDGTDTISVTASANLILRVGDSVIAITKEAIDIQSKNVNAQGTDQIIAVGGEHGFSATKGGEVNVGGKNTGISGSDEVTIGGKKASITGDAEVSVSGKQATVNGDANLALKSSGPTSVEGAIVKLN